MHISTKKRFNKIGDKFTKSDYDLSTIRWVISEVRNTIWDMNQAEFKKLISIPRSILKEDVYIKDYEVWQKENKDYLLENLSDFKEEYFIELKGKIYSEKYSVRDMLETIDYMIDNFDDLQENHSGNMEMLLRNIELGFRKLKLSNEKEIISNRELFSKYIENVVNEAL
ncbi:MULTISPECIES: hypothetical protein [unclassified Clostridium]|uniref:hypothetical protein n=1 Tax=unclassified Clostridium TaxID=2614128 RepID=UPI0013F11D43|nr:MULTISPECIES: hypothetical protein [unclassified Clostridium]NFG61386.1 hypothetical protein [Clostridium botulinum]NFQ10368.1 hypothetical protein [Clostridium botulinum]